MLSAVNLWHGNEAGRGDRKISPAEIPLIKEHVLPGYDPQDDRFVNKHNLAVCNSLYDYAGSHRPLVLLAERGSSPPTLWSSPPCTPPTCAASRPGLRQPAGKKTVFALFARGQGCLVELGMLSERKWGKLKARTRRTSSLACSGCVQCASTQYLRCRHTFQHL